MSRIECIGQYGISVMPKPPRVVALDHGPPVSNKLPSNMLLLITMPSIDPKDDIDDFSSLI